MKGFFWRMREKYVIRDFHPLVFFYAPRHRDDPRRPRARHPRDRAAASSATASRPPTVVLVALLLISGSQFTLFAMWFDMESNKDLR